MAHDTRFVAAPVRMRVSSSSSKIGCSTPSNSATGPASRKARVRRKPGTRPAWHRAPAALQPPARRTSLPVEQAHRWADHARTLHRHGRHGAQDKARTLRRHVAHLVAHRRLEVQPLVHVPMHLGVVLERARAGVIRTGGHSRSCTSLLACACRNQHPGRPAPASPQPPHGHRNVNHNKPTARSRRQRRAAACSGPPEQQRLQRQQHKQPPIPQPAQHIGVRRLPLRPRLVFWSLRLPKIARPGSRAPLTRPSPAPLSRALCL